MSLGGDRTTVQGESLSWGGRKVSNLTVRSFLSPVSPQFASLDINSLHVHVAFPGSSQQAPHKFPGTHGVGCGHGHKGAYAETRPLPKWAVEVTSYVKR